jgi:hypothetical protein
MRQRVALLRDALNVLNIEVDSFTFALEKDEGLRLRIITIRALEVKKY